MPYKWESYRICADVHRAALMAIQEDYPTHSISVSIRDCGFYTEWTEKDNYEAHTTFYQAYQDQVYRISNAIFLKESKRHQAIMMKTGMIYGQFRFFIYPPALTTFHNH